MFAIGAKAKAEGVFRQLPKNGGLRSANPPYRLRARQGGRSPAKSLIRMFCPRGNPQVKNLFAFIGYLQKKAGLHLRVAG